MRPDVDPDGFKIFWDDQEEAPEPDHSGPPLVKESDPELEKLLDEPLSQTELAECAVKRNLERTEITRLTFSIEASSEFHLSARDIERARKKLHTFIAELEGLRFVVDTTTTETVSARHDNAPF